MRFSRFRWGISLLLTFTLSGLAAGYAAWRLLDLKPLQGKTAQAATSGQADLTGQTETVPPVNRTVILVMGVDRSKALADSNLLVSIDPKTNEIGVVSIPRDTLVEIPGHGWDKLTHAHSYGGEQLSMAVISKLLDIPIDHYAVVDFDGFEKVVDAVGGVDIEVTKPMNYDDPYDGLHIHFKPGLYHMNGKQALEYARYRSDSDIFRMKRQQEIIRKVAEKAMQPSMVWKLPDLVQALYGTVKTDLSIREGLALALAARDVLSKGNLQMTVLHTGTDRYLRRSDSAPHGVYYLVPDIVAYRTEAYRTLYGTEPPADYLERARAAQADVDATVDRLEAEDEDWLARHHKPAQTARQPREEQVASRSEEPAVKSPAAESGGTRTGGNPGTQGPGAGGQAEAPKSGPSEATTWTAVLVDASGRNRLAQYRADLEALGLQVVAQRKADSVLPRSLLIDHSGESRLGTLLRQRYPWAEYQAAPGEGLAVEFYLGADAP